MTDSGDSIVNEVVPARSGKEPRCRCGRRLEPTHCPYCGSTNRYGKHSNDEVFFVGNEKRIARGYVCRRCGENYNTAIECQAPAEQVLNSRQQREKLTALERQQAAMAETGMSNPRDAVLEQIKRQQEFRDSMQQQRKQRQAAALLFEGAGKKASELEERPTEGGSDGTDNS